MTQELTPEEEAFDFNVALANLDLQRRDLIRAERLNLLGCSSGGPHTMVYLGKKTQMYRCEKCLTDIPKSALQVLDIA